MRSERDNIDAHVTDPAACAGMTYTSGSVLGGIVTDFLACKAGIDANNTAVDAILVALEEQGIVASA